MRTPPASMLPGFELDDTRVPSARLHAHERRSRARAFVLPLALAASLSAFTAAGTAIAQGTAAPAAPTGSVPPTPSASTPPPELPPPAPPTAPAGTDSVTANDNTTPVPPPPGSSPVASTDVSTGTKTAEDARLDGVPDDFSRLILDDGRMPFKRRPERRTIQFEAHGELQVRYENLSALRLTPPATDPSQQLLGQRNYGTAWIRIGGNLLLGESLKVVVQFDLIPRWILGDVTQGVSAAGDWARDEQVPAIARLRYAHLDWTTPIGLLRIGQTGNNWGMGILANNGDRPLIFGDYRMGSIVERIAFATRPGGKSSPFVIAIAGDAVLHDATSKWTDGDRTYQAVVSAYYEKDWNQIGFFGVRRWQNPRPELEGGKRPSLYVWVADVAGKAAIPISDDVFAFGAFELAAIRGKTDAIRSTPEFNEQDVASYGFASQLGLVKRGRMKVNERDVTFGKLVALVEGGHASGDANPYDGKIKRFTFDPNHQVGLLMFPYVLHFHTARAATNGQDLGLLARAQPGARFLSSRGGVFGASYLNPMVIFRPRADLDLKAGAVIAVASSEVVDPYRTAISPTGGDQSYNGGSPKSRDLGLELDGGFEWRVQVPNTMTLQIGLQAGVFFPGRAFDDAKGNRAKTQSIVQGRLGVQF